MTVYRITNTINGKIYIGQTTLTTDRRWKMHLRDCTKERNNKFYNAIKKYGSENFAIDIVEENITSKEMLNEREKYWIAHYDCYKNGYNSTPGGETSPMCDPIVAKKISETMKGRKFTEEHKRHIREAMAGKSGTPHTEEHKKYMSELMMNRVVSEQTCEKLRQINTGKKQSIATRKKRSEAMKGRKFTEEHKSKISESLKINSYRVPGKEHARSKAIMQIDKTTGETVNVFESANMASKHFKKKSAGDITNCANGVKTKSAYGYKWKWVL